MENTQRVLDQIHAHLGNVAGVLPTKFGKHRMTYNAPNDALLIIDVMEDEDAHTQIRVRLITEFTSVTQSISRSVAYSVGRALIAIVNG